MIQRDDILSMEYLKKTDYTGCHQGMRYRLEGIVQEEEKRLKVTVWPEPFNYYKTPSQEKKCEFFDFGEDGIVDAIAWMNDQLFENKEKWDRAGKNWKKYAEM